MEPIDFLQFFGAAFADGRQPYDYQQRLAVTQIESRLHSVPSGLCNAAADVLPFL